MADRPRPRWTSSPKPTQPTSDTAEGDGELFGFVVPIDDRFIALRSSIVGWLNRDLATHGREPGSADRSGMRRRTLPMRGLSVEDALRDEPVATVGRPSGRVWNRLVAVRSVWHAIGQTHAMPALRIDVQLN